jgi:hypothetical protein
VAGLIGDEEMRSDIHCIWDFAEHFHEIGLSRKEGLAVRLIGKIWNDWGRIRTLRVAVRSFLNGQRRQRPKDAGGGEPC